MLLCPCRRQSPELVPWAEEGLVGVGVGEVPEVGELDGHGRLRAPEEAAHQLGRPRLGRRRPAAGRHQVRRHLHNLAAEHRQHPHKSPNQPTKKNTLRILLIYTTPATQSS